MQKGFIRKEIIPISEVENAVKDVMFCKISEILMLIFVEILLRETVNAFRHFLQKD